MAGRGGAWHAAVAAALACAGAARAEVSSPPPGATAPAETLAPAPSQPTAPVPYRVVSGEIAEPLGGATGDAARGRAIVGNRQQGLCLLCHPGPFPEERFQGDLAPDLAGAGKRLSAGQLRLRIADSRQLNPGTIMPSYHGAAPHARIGRAWQGRTIFTAQQVEDVVAYLQTLK